MAQSYRCVCMVLLIATAYSDSCLDTVAVTYSNLGYTDGDSYKSQIRLDNTGGCDIATDHQNNITLYSCFIRLILGSRAEHGALLSADYDVRAYHIDGCAHKIVFGSSFKLPSGKSVTLDLTQQYWLAAYSDIMPNWYIQLGHNEPKLIKNTQDPKDFVNKFVNEGQIMRNALDKVYPWSPEQRYERHAKLSEVKDSASIKQRIVPSTSSSLEQKFSQFIGPYKDISEISIVSVLDSSMASGAYQIEVWKDSPLVTIKSSSNSTFRLSQSTVQQLLERNDGKLPVGALPVNKPRYSYRGLMLDIARHFHSKDSIIKLIDLMWRYKLNNLHLHLTDDESWAIEIDNLPELTEYGSKQCFDAEKCSNYPQLGRKADSQRYFLTKLEYIDIIRHAMEKGINIIPEIDMPGHSTAAIQAMKLRSRKLEQQGRPFIDYRLDDPNDRSQYLSAQYFTKGVINPCISTTYKFIDLMMKTMKRYHAEAGQELRLIHVGGDEVPSAWDNSTACNALIKSLNESSDYIKKQMLRRIGLLAHNNNLSIALWEDGLINDLNEPIAKKEDLFPSDVDVYAYTWQTVWEWGGGSRPYALANSNYKIVLCPANFFYVDHPHEPHPEERGYYWATRFSDLWKVFSFRSHDIYENINGTDGFGNLLERDSFCNKSEIKCPSLRKPENIVGGQAALFGETIFNLDHVDNNIWPRLLAVSERLWKEPSWERIPGDSAELKNDFNHFMTTVSAYEIPFLEKNGVKYHLSPPGATKVNESKQGLVLDLNTEFIGQRIWLRTDEQTLREVNSTINLSPPTSKTFYLSSSDSEGKRFSYEIEYHVEAKQQPSSCDSESKLSYLLAVMSIVVSVIKVFYNKI